MKAISLWQPYASLIACGAKKYETRSWAPSAGLIGQPLAIHAAKRIDADLIPFVEDLVFGQHDPGGHALADLLDRTWEQCPDKLFAAFGHAVMPIGCVVAIARLRGAYLCGDPLPEAMGAASVVRHIGEPRTSIELDDFGDYSPGRWAWRLTDVRAIDPPVPMRGQQGLFELPSGWLAEEEETP